MRPKSQGQRFPGESLTGARGKMATARLAGGGAQAKKRPWVQCHRDRKASAKRQRSGTAAESPGGPVQRATQAQFMGAQLRAAGPPASVPGKGIDSTRTSSSFRGCQALNRRLASSICSVVMWGSIDARICELP